MALSSTVYKASLQIADMDRNYYAGHELTLARHPSETDERLMVRIMAFARHASENLSFAQGRLGAGVKGSADEPDLWEKDLTGVVERWIEVGLPDEKAIRQACGRAKAVIVYAYGGNKAEQWWDKNRRDLGRQKNLTVNNISPDTTRALAALVQRDLQLHVTIQDGEMLIADGNGAVQVELAVLLQGKT